MPLPILPHHPMPHQPIPHHIDHLQENIVLSARCFVQNLEKGAGPLQVSLEHKTDYQVLGVPPPANQLRLQELDQLAGGVCVEGRDVLLPLRVDVGQQLPDVAREVELERDPVDVDPAQLVELALQVVEHQQVLVELDEVRLVQDLLQDLVLYLVEEALVEVDVEERLDLVHRVVALVDAHPDVEALQVLEGLLHQQAAPVVLPDLLLQVREAPVLQALVELAHLLVQHAVHLLAAHLVDVLLRAAPVHQVVDVHKIRRRQHVRVAQHQIHRLLY